MRLPPPNIAIHKLGERNPEHWAAEVEFFLPAPLENAVKYKEFWDLGLREWDLVGGIWVLEE